VTVLRRHQLLIYGFEPGANFEGRLVGALERLQATGESRVLDGLFVANDPDTGELAATDLRSGGSADAMARLLTFRLDAGARRDATAKALGEPGSVPADVIEGIGGALGAGRAMLALLIDGGEPEDLKDAVARTGGRSLRAEPVEGSSLAELAPELISAVSSPRRS